MTKCGDCVHYEHFCSPYALPDEDFAEFGGCKVFKNKADFVEVVRCKDCKHYGDVGDCEVHPYEGRISVNYFCADGERRAEE